MQYGNIAHSPQRCSVLVGPHLRAGRFLACTVTLLGRLGDPPLPHSLARMRSLNTHELELESVIALPKSIYPKSSTHLRAKFWSNQERGQGRFLRFSAT